MTIKTKNVRAHSYLGWEHLSTVGQNLKTCPDCEGPVQLTGTNYLYYRCGDCGHYWFFGIDFTNCHQYREPHYYTPLEIERRFPISRKESGYAKPRDIMFGMAWETDGRIDHLLIYRHFFQSLLIMCILRPYFLIWSVLSPILSQNRFLSIIKQRCLNF